MRKLCARQEGQTLTEYAVLLAVMSLGLVGALTLLRDELGTFLTSLGGQL
jgi:Flp pilus assembly pilin Flp